MITKNYIIKITGTDRQHTKAREQIEKLSKELVESLISDVDFYIQPVKIVKKPGNGKFYLYGLGSKKVLTNMS